MPSENKTEAQEKYFLGQRSCSCKFIGLPLLVTISFLVEWSYIVNDNQKHPPISSFSRHFAELHNSSTSDDSAGSHSLRSFFQSEFGISSQSYYMLQEAVYWPGPHRRTTSLLKSSSPEHTKFTIQNLKESYQTGEELFVMVHAKDFKKRLKRYGGDFFQAKLFWSRSKASVFGEVVDLLNGSYSVRFLLPWVGQAQVAVRLIHSSEAVQVLKHHRDTDSDRVSYNGYYEAPGPNKTRLSEVVECNVKWDKNGLERLGTKNCCCEYSDLRTRETWRCKKPKSLPCSALVYHSLGSYRNRLKKLEQTLIQKSNKAIRGDKRIIKILHSHGNKTIEKCRPGLHTPVPAGFFLHDVWTSFVCNTSQFTPQTTTKCLKDKHIYMMGDSTMRQWFEFFVKTIPTLKQMNLHVRYQTGPLMAVDVENNIDLHWRAHGLPLRTLKTAVASLHYISNEIDDLAGGPHTIIMLNLGPHFTTYPLDFFTLRVLRIRKAVLALLQRAPDTTVIIKTVNTGYKDIFGSDWYSLQLNRVLRWAFQDVGVYILDVWQMTACHYSKENIHPGPIIIKNEIDVLLSFICPK
ncbi:NXPE family member 3 isoform X1 [Danio rerio]|uniref:NXPE family member 3 isoform X1 n=1 Tax=Danio rerio TaxID=7955 RepID=A0AB32T5N6_DANRE